jgi:hypothetical protein
MEMLEKRSFMVDAGSRGGFLQGADCLYTELFFLKKRFRYA